MASDMNTEPLGAVFHEWTVIGTREWSHLPSGKRRSAYMCRCTCGKEKVVTQGNLRSGMSKNCGHGPLTQGYASHPIYYSWKAMMSRCYRDTDVASARYKGKGITVEECWHDFQVFRSDMEPTWAPGLSVDRKDNNGNYTRDNCRWATRLEQGNNTSRALAQVYGKTSAEIAKETGVSVSAVQWRHNNGKDVYAPHQRPRAEAKPKRDPAITIEGRFGKTAKAIGLETGLHPTTVRWRIRNKRNPYTGEKE